MSPVCSLPCTTSLLMVDFQALAGVCVKRCLLTYCSGLAKAFIPICQTLC